jgi:Flp pilus assembly pilin Flp
MKKTIFRFLADSRGQTTVEWAVLSIMIAMTMIVVGLAFANSMPPIFEALYQKIVDLANSIGL